MVRPTVLLAEGHPLIAEALRALLVENFQVPPPVSDGLRVLDAIGRWEPHVVILPLALPNKNALQLIRDIGSSYPDLRVLVMSLDSDHRIADALIRIGAAGIVVKGATHTDLVNAVAGLAEGEVPVVVPTSARLQAAPWGLTRRQLEILRLLASGYTSKEIAALLGISYWTVHCHRKRIGHVLGVRLHSDSVDRLLGKKDVEAGVLHEAVAISGLVPLPTRPVR